jgi:hypothetical protein
MEDLDMSGLGADQESIGHSTNVVAAVQQGDYLLDDHSSVQFETIAEHDGPTLPDRGCRQ